MNKEMILEQLSRPFPKEEVKWRVGATNVKKIIRETGNKNAKPTKGTMLAYVDARAIQDRLDDVLGVDWDCRYPSKGYCEIGVYIDGVWRWRGNGAGETEFEGEKGQYSDSFKRAAVLWGPARYLYHLPAEWVDLDEWGKPKKIPELPKWALPGYVKPMNPALKKEYVERMDAALQACDEMAVKELSEELTNEQKLYVWSSFNSAQRSLIRDFIKLY